MGSALLRVVVRRRSDKPSLSDLNNNLELGECVFDSKQLHLLESPPLGIRHQKIIIKPQLFTKSSKIGKIARIPNRKIRDEQQVIAKVSNHQLSYHLMETSDWLIARPNRIKFDALNKTTKSSRLSSDKRMEMVSFKKGE